MSRSLVILVILLSVWGCQDEQAAPADTSLPLLQTERESGIRFKEFGAERGLTHTHFISEPENYDFPKVMGAGCAVLDINNDSLLDLLFLGGSSNPEDPNICHLYRQISSGKFELVKDSGLDQVAAPMGIAAADVNNDGAVDLYISAIEEDYLFINRSGKFIDITKDSGISNLQWGASCTWLDFDRDGWLDLFVTNYVVHRKRSCIRLSGGDQDFCGPQMFPDTIDRLFRNMGSENRDSENVASVRFEDVTDRSGIGSKTGPGLGVAAVDFTGDGWVDIYVANDQAANVLWVNQKDGTFVDEAAIRGCDVSYLGQPQASMGIAVGDINADQLSDITLTHLEFEKHTAYLSDSQSFFVDRADQLGIGLPSLPMTGFGVALEDFDADGDLDLFTVNGHVKRPDSTLLAANDFWKPYRQFPQIFEYADLKFEQCNTSNFEQMVGRGLASGDLDRDGDLDLVAVNINDRPSFFQNETDFKGNWLIVRLIDPEKSSRDAIGANVSVISDVAKQSRSLQPGTSYMSSNAAELFFGFSKPTQSCLIKVVWPDGSLEPESFKVQRMNRSISLSRGAGAK